MEPLYYVIAIMGCGDAGMQCQQQRVDPVRYRSAVQCQAAMANVLERHTDLSFPIVQANCQRNGTNMVERDRARTRG